MQRPYTAFGVTYASNLWVDDAYTNVRVSDGVVVKFIIYRGGSPIEFSHVALRTGEATILHEKFGRVLGWQLGKRYRLKIECTTDAFRALEIPVNGARVDSDPSGLGRY